MTLPHVIICYFVKKQYNSTSFSSMAEWSNVLVKGISIFGGMGSNPAAATW